MINDFSVVLCAKNEANRIESSLKGIIKNGPFEIIVVDGNSKDKTVEVAKKYTDKVIVSKAGGLTYDRQIGIDAATCNYIAMIDADHVLEENDIKNLIKDLKHYKLDIVQSQLKSFKNLSYWNKAEEQEWDLTENFPGRRKHMLGTAPAIYKKKIFKDIKFDGYITTKMDDIDFFYRLSKLTNYKFGMGKTKIAQLHHSNFKHYLKKFMWYGIGDGEFCRKYPARSVIMLYHLLFRYPFIYSFKAVKKGYYAVVPYFILKGVIRFFGLIIYFLKMIRINIRLIK